MPVKMRIAATMVAALLVTGAPAPLAAQQASKAPPSFITKSGRLSQGESAALTQILANAQQRVRAREKLYFTLLSGAPAAFPQTQITPRDAFLNLPLDKVWAVEVVDVSNNLWRRYRVIVPVDGLGKPMWYVEVVLGSGDRLQRVELLFAPPPPF